MARAAPTLLSTALCTLDNAQPPIDLWRAAFALTYAAELRAEKGDRSASVVDASLANRITLANAPYLPTGTFLRDAARNGLYFAVDDQAEPVLPAMSI